MTAADLRAHARADAEKWSVVHRPQGPLTLAPRLKEAESELNALMAELNGLPTGGEQGPNPLLEIRENPRLFRAVLTETASIQRKIPRLPRVLSSLGEEPRAAVLAAAYLNAAKSVWNGSALRIYLDEAQASDSLELRELWVLPTFMKFALLDLILVQADARLHQPQSKDAGTPQLLIARIKSLRELGFADWLSLMEPLVVFDPILMKDPAKAYPRMDFDSRERYRKRVAEIALCSEQSESQVAQAAVDFALKAQQNRIDDPRLYLRQAHVGYYLNDRGFTDLARHIGYRPRLIDRIRMALRRHADDFLYRRHRDPHGVVDRRDPAAADSELFGLRRADGCIHPAAAAGVAGRGGPASTTRLPRSSKRPRCRSWISPKASRPSTPRWSRCRRCC